MAKIVVANTVVDPRTMAAGSEHLRQYTSQVGRLTY
jgi:hypothetical protein